MTTKRTIFGLICTIITTIIAVILYPHVKKEVMWRRKLRRYTQRQVTIFECVQNADLRIRAAARDRNVSRSDLKRIMTEEKRFIALIENQPL